MPLTDVLQRHWKKLALLGLVVAIGICVAIGLAVSNDVEQPEDEQAPEGGNPGAQIGNGPPPNSGSGKVEIIGGVRVPPKLREFNKEKTVPNFFERTRDPATGELTPPDSHYRGGTAVFLQNQNSGGQLMKLCMNKIFKDKQSSLQPTIVTKDSFDSFYDNLKQKDANTIPKTVVGDCVLGTCEYTPEGWPCSYFTIISDPFERAVTTYVACLSNRENCEGLDPQKTSLTEWAQIHGDYFLRQLLESHASCSNEANLTAAMQGIQDEALDMASDGLDRWFSVICTTADIESCFRVLQEVYGTPYFDACGGENLVDLKNEIEKKVPSDEVLQMLMSQVVGGHAPTGYHELASMLRKQLEDAPDDYMHADKKLFSKSTTIFANEKSHL